MGTWGPHSFENDDARDWCQAYREMGLPVAASTIQVALGDFESGGLSADIAARAIAAMEAVAHALGHGSVEANEVFAGAPQADKTKAQDLVSDCDHLIMAMTGGSELAQLWKEAAPGEHERWIAALTDLRTRVNGGQSEPSGVPEAAESSVAVSTSSVSSQDQLIDVRNAIGQLENDIQVLRQELRDGLLDLARRIEGAKG